MEINRGLSYDRINKYFNKNGEKWELKNSIRKMVDFINLNLAKPLPYMGKFDLIICRNVLIYFDEETRARIFSAFSNILTDDGFLLLGASENTYGVTDKFVSDRFGNTLFYKKS